jgi:hypothetical protein
VIFLSDGERPLQDRQTDYLPENTICILNLFHVLEGLRKMECCFFDERTIIRIDASEALPEPLSNKKRAAQLCTYIHLKGDSYATRSKIPLWGSYQCMPGPFWLNAGWAPSRRRRDEPGNGRERLAMAVEVHICRDSGLLSSFCICALGSADGAGGLK